jgi:hypothetical protein
MCGSLGSFAPDFRRRAIAEDAGHFGIGEFSKLWFRIGSLHSRAANALRLRDLPSFGVVDDFNFALTAAS